MNCTMKFRMSVYMLPPMSEVIHIPKDYDELWKFTPVVRFSRKRKFWIPYEGGNYLNLLATNASNPCTGPDDPQDVERLPGFLNDRQVNVANLSALFIGRLYPPGDNLSRHFCWKWQEGLNKWKIPMTPSGIEAATVRFVAQCQNQLCHRLLLVLLRFDIYYINKLPTNVLSKSFSSFFITKHPADSRLICPPFISYCRPCSEEKTEFYALATGVCRSTEYVCAQS
jgi:hypothetical protein